MVKKGKTFKSNHQKQIKVKDVEEKKELQAYKSTKVQKNKSTAEEKYRSTKVQKYTSTKVQTCPALPCPALRCAALRCPVLSCPVLRCASPSPSPRTRPRSSPSTRPSPSPSPSPAPKWRRVSCEQQLGHMVRWVPTVSVHRWFPSKLRSHSVQAFQTLMGLIAVAYSFMALRRDPCRGLTWLKMTPTPTWSGIKATGCLTLYWQKAGALKRLWKGKSSTAFRRNRTRTWDNANALRNYVEEK